MNEEPKQRDRSAAPVRTPAGDRWRQRLRRADGTLPLRTESLEAERRFWRRRMAAGPPQPDAYAVEVYAQVERLAGAHGVRTVLEIGPGWGNYTFPLCRSFAEVTCVDVSPENLAYLSRRAEEEGLCLETICGPWEATGAPRRDMVFAYNCFYRMDQPEWFLEKINAGAETLCVIGMNCPPELPWLPELERAGLPVRYTRQGCRELQEILRELGISARMTEIPNERTYRWQDEEALMRRAGDFLTEPCGPEFLRPLILPYCERGADGCLICRYPFRSQLLSWVPDRP